tara:strand:+ start:281 stop:1078 length:798 start_codon:yes stop_codon:yes gene_type:complete
LEKKVNLRVLSLGAGVQSSTLALMIEKGQIPMVDAAIFADTQAESKETYEFLDWLKSKLSYPIYILSKGDLTDHLLNTDFPIAPFYSLDTLTGKKGLMMRQCTNDYKISIITQKVRQLLGLKKRQKVKKGTRVEMLMGISKDEIFRIKDNRLPYITNVYPLIEMNMRRQNCVEWFNKYYDKIPPRSACIYCPYKNDKEWKHLRKNNPDEWKQVVEFDKKIRNNSRKKEVEVYVHRSCKPIGEVDLNKGDDQMNLFDSLCEGYCGN